jgi:hypothetical protein
LFIHTFKNSGIPAAGSDSESSVDGSDEISSDAHSEYESEGSDDALEDSEPPPPASDASLPHDGDRQKTLKDQTFGNFEELKKYVESITFVAMSNNKRTTRFQLAPAWFKDAFPNADICWLNGTLYCHQPRKQSYDQYVKWAKTMCTCKVRYALCSKTKRWRISEFDDRHNHEVQSHVEQSATGIVHIRNAARLNQDMIVAINNWLDAHISEYSQLFRAPTHLLTPSRNQRN